MTRAERREFQRAEAEGRTQICVWCAKARILSDFRPLERDPMAGRESICDYCWQEAHSRGPKVVVVDPTNEPGVYFARSGKNGHIKIGYADNPHRRLISLQIGNPEELVLLRVIPGGSRLEAELHRQFAHLLVQDRRALPRGHPLGLRKQGDRMTLALIIYLAASYLVAGVGLAWLSTAETWEPGGRPLTVFRHAAEAVLITLFWPLLLLALALEGVTRR